MTGTDLLAILNRMSFAELKNDVVAQARDGMCYDVYPNVRLCHVHEGIVHADKTPNCIVIACD